jgi:hypothetical protein
VLLETSDAVSGAHATARFDELMERALEQGLVADAVVAQSISQSRRFWMLRAPIGISTPSQGPAGGQQTPCAGGCTTRKRPFGRTRA